MNTPTPRTDAAAIPFHAIKLPYHPSGLPDYTTRWVPRDKMAELEQELNEAKSDYNKCAELLEDRTIERDTLKRERDEAMKEADKQTEIADAMTEYQGVEAHLIRENLQLRRVCDELAAVVRGEFGNYNWRVSAYNQLPHVLERKTK